MIRVDGKVRTARDFSFADLAALPEQIADVAAIVPGRAGGAVRLSALLTAAGASADATAVTLESSDGKFSQQAPLAALGSAIVVYRLGDARLPSERGGPARFLIPNLEDCNLPGVDRCTNVKALARIEVR
jgi:DMSO/TMAO reductase YedYZ molybdopterin-dependent catalytic subunit